MEDITKELQEIEEKQWAAVQRAFWLLKGDMQGQPLNSEQKYTLQKICHNAAISWADRLDLSKCADFSEYIEGIHTNRRGRSKTYAAKVAQALK